ncbi:MAG: hypothetical protein Unbinned5081contig1002_35 [Prokaryotic dsDNA virus sp.]|nr:MAG: hypothetical protein Unbinned5081contig1002_35 [Prokaryotic dsDNA virus sp.]|tara:strand:- start:30373 stop:30510 length:138 start_codon:yes stop_codon:yes gene_type:complete
MNNDIKIPKKIILEYIDRIGSSSLCTKDGKEALDILKETIEEEFK